MGKIMTAGGQSVGESLYLTQSIRRYFVENQNIEMDKSLQDLRDDLNDPEISLHLVGITKNRADPLHIVAFRADGKKRLYEIETDKNLKFEGVASHIKEKNLPDYAQQGLEVARETFNASHRAQHNVSPPKQ
jgi:hypothetical protein